MGLLDRLKKAPGPDALTWEAVARARAVPSVTGAEAADADTVLVTWLDDPGTTTLSLADVRARWTEASGFDRIEIMDQLIAGLAPPPDPTTHQGVSSSPTEGDGTGAWNAARRSASVVVVRAGALHGAVRWQVVEGIDAVASVGGRPVTDDDLARWDVRAEDVRAAALDRLAGEGPALEPIGPDARAWVPGSAAAPPPAWIALPGVLLSAAGLAGAVALAPLPTELVLIDPDDTELLASVLSSTAAIVEGASEVLLAAPLLVATEGCRPWVPAHDHPCAALVERLRAAG